MEDRGGAGEANAAYSCVDTALEELWKEVERGADPAPGAY